MNRPKCARRNLLWSTRQAGRPAAYPAVAISLEAGSPAPASAAGYIHRPHALPASAAAAGGASGLEERARGRQGEGGACPGRLVPSAEAGWVGGTG